MFLAIAAILFLAFAAAAPASRAEPVRVVVDYPP